jgi:NADH:ubiquinone oxidoreductase subunit E
VPSHNDVVEIVVCLGSSCFARGNAENLAIIHEYIQGKTLTASVRVTGRLCQDECKQGPNLMIGGQIHHGVTTERLRELLQQSGGHLGEDHGTA